MLLKICVVFGVAMTLSLRARGADDARNAGDNIDGTWLPSAAELGGKPWPEQFRKITKLVVDGDKYIVTVGEAPDKGTIKLDPSAKPRALDVTGTEGPNKGKTFLAIYERNGDTLRICYDLSGKARPSEFKSTEGSMLFLVTYERQKPTP
jgi:uncharacterized protein (TIGR03067 family)